MSRIEEIRELEKLATPAPWERVDDILCLEKSKALCCTWPNFASEDDWILVRALRNNILAILDDNERLQAENAQLQRERDAAAEDLIEFKSCRTCVSGKEYAEYWRMECIRRSGDAVEVPPFPVGCEENYWDGACDNWRWRGGPQEVEHG